MKKLLSLLLIICSIGVAYADDKSTVTSLKYVTDELNTRQDKFGANDGKAMTFTNVAGGNLPRDVKESLGTSTTDNGLPTVSAVNTGIATKQDEIGAVNTNTVVTYTGTPGTIGQKGIYQDTGTYASQQNNLIDAGTFNAALKNGLDNEFVCAGYATTGECWLWSIRNDAPNRSPNLFDSKSTRVMNLADALALLQENKPVYCAANVYTGSTVGDVLAFNTVQNALAIPFTLGDTFYVKYFGSDTYTPRHRWCTTDANGIVIEKASRDYTMNSPITPTLPASYIFIQWANYMTPEQLSECMVIKDSAPITDFVPYGNVYIPQNQSAQNQ